MAKAYVVYKMWHEVYDKTEVYDSESVEKVFFMEDAAIAYIKDAFKAVHSWALNAYPDNENLKLYDSDSQYIQEGQAVRVMDIFEDYDFKIAVHYRYESRYVE